MIKMNLIKAIAALVLLGFSVRGQEQFEINWQAPINAGEIAMPWFQYASSNVHTPYLPSYCSSIYSESPGTLELTHVEYGKLTTAEMESLEQKPSAEEVVFDFAYKDNTFNFCILPFRVHPSTGEIEKVLSFGVIVNQTTDNQTTITNKTGSADTSVLASGNWYKVAVSRTGVFKLTPQFLADCGLGSNIPSTFIRVFGNGNGMLSERNDENPNPELQEVPLFVNDGGDGIFNGNDFALFYAVGPHTWQYDETNDRFTHTYNIYSEQSFYFLNVDGGVGKRIQQTGYSPSVANYQSDAFDDFAFFEEDRVNLVGSGREWFGDLFDFKLTHDYAFQFNNVRPDTAWLTTRAVARSVAANRKMTYTVNGVQVAETYFPAVGSGSGAPFVSVRSTKDAFIPNGSSINVQAVYNNNVSSSATAWMDYITLQVRCHLTMTGSGIVFRDARAYRAGGTAEYEINGANGNALIWDVTNHQHPRIVPHTLNGSIARFKAPSDTLRTFAAVQGAGFPLPSKVGEVENQNLHALENVDMVIVAHPQFLVQAKQLAAFHHSFDNMNVKVVTPQQIYNEFSSGMQDITAIKLFFRHLYKKGGSNPLSHVLLFGDASYDYKDRTANMYNFVPIFQSSSSFNLRSSYCTDDFYGYLEDGEGNHLLFEDVDIGIGRFPVTTVAQAQAMVNKVVTYSTNSKCHGDWRNRAMLITDDVDDPGGSDAYEMGFVEFMDNLAQEMDTVVGSLNLAKVYIDSYSQEVKAGSQRYPEARDAIFRNVQRGNLVTSYLGHGGEAGWAKERILQLVDINGWDNLYNMPVFTTITCEFSRLDDPTRVSAGEQLFLNSEGGAAALYSTLRPVFATTSTYLINNRLFEFLFMEANGEFLTLGEVNRATKNASTSGDRLRFALIGDPAMKLAIPRYRVVTDSINGVDVSQFNDTLKALSQVKVHGHVEDLQGNLVTDYSGIVNPTVYDKKAPKKTLMNDGYGYEFNYETRENIIYRGKSSVEGGQFTFEFVIPLDINFVVGEGKFSYYATDSTNDAAGYNSDLLIGSLNLNATPDDKGPEVRVFINDTNFISGGLTDVNPVNISLISDSSGINTVGSGIGHDILGILDGETNSPFILNDYFQSDLNSFQSGAVTFPFFELSPGEHHLLVRAWDVNNNMGEGETYFIVDNSHGLALKRVLNYPNPFSDFTTFQFEHNRAGEPLEVDIQIFDQYGRLVHRIEERVTSLGNRVNQISWDGTNAGGSPLGSGVFVYRVKVRSLEDGSESTGYSKLVFVK